MSEASIFASALEMSPGADRADFVAEACGGDAKLRRRVEALLRAHDEPDDALDPIVQQTAAYASIAEKTGMTVGPYVLREQIGEGGFGLVFVAEQTEPVKRKVALKVIKPGMDSRQVIARFEAERQALALMDHPNIAKVLDAGSTDSGRPYFVMELVRGIPITEYCDKHQLSPKERLELFVTVCHAIQHAHQKGVIHRDIKPSNVLVTSHDGKPVAKVIDFGVAKAIHQQLTERTIYTNFAQMIGTPLYMSPEQAEMSGLDIDTRSDVYSLGVLLYELLTGTTPLEKKRLASAAYDEVRRMIREEEPPKPSTRLSSTDAIASIAAHRHSEPAKLSKLVRGDLDWITMKALEKDRTRRYETANGLARDIQRYLGDEPVEACPPSATYRLRKFARKNRASISTAAAFAILLIVGSGVSLWQAVRAMQAETAALEAQQAEAERAEGERQAKQEAESKREEAERNLAFAKKGNEILGSVFAGLNPNAIAESGRPLQDALKDNLAKAVKELDGAAIGDPLEVAAMQNRLGYSLLSLGEPSLAVVVLEKALETRKAGLGPEHPDTLICMSNLAYGYHTGGKLDMAVALHQEILKLRKAIHGPDHQDTLTTMSNMAECYRVAGKLNLALPLYEEALARTRSRVGADQLETLAIVNNLALAYKDAGKLELAIPLFEEAVRLMTIHRGSSHPDTLKCVNNLALGYLYMGNLAKALPLYEDNLRRMKSNLGADHPVTLIGMAGLADGYRAAGKLDLAVPLYEETLHLQKSKQGAGHPHTLNSMNNLAAGYFYVGRLEQAVRLWEEALPLQRAKLGAGHAYTLATISGLAEGYLATGRADRAVPLLQESLTLHKAKQGADHPDTIACMSNLAVAYAKARRTVECVTIATEALAIGRRKTFRDSPQLAGLIVQCGLPLLEAKEFAEAEPLLREALAIREKTQPDVWSTFNTKSMLGGALLGQKKYADAEPHLLNGYQGMKAREKTIPPAAATRIPEALDRLIDLYTATNRSDEVKKWQAERAKYLAPKSK